MRWIQTIKNVLKLFLPAPVRTFLREINGLRDLLTEQEQRLLQENRSLRQQMAEQYAQLLALQQLQSEQVEKAFEEIAAGQRQRSEQMETLLDAISCRQQRQLAAAGQQQEAVRELAQSLEGIAAAQQEFSAGQAEIDTKLKQTGEQQEKLAGAVERARRQSLEGARYASEAVWAEIFNNAVSGSAWLSDKAFAPGRWAVGYPYLYVMYRVLNEARPKRILELGLGQSTRMIAQYAAVHEGVTHIVVEHDPDWIRFFQNDFELSARSKIVQLDREMAPYKEAEAVRVFKGFREMFAGQTFDFISIDAPLGGDMKQYARIDVLGLLPECLSEDFVIMIDDYERSGETHTLAEMERRLNECGIPYKRGRYSGKKDCALISAEHMGFLTTM